MREKPIGVVLTLLAVLAVGSAPAAFVAFGHTRTPRPAVADKIHRSEQPRRR